MILHKKTQTSIARSAQSAAAANFGREKLRPLSCAFTYTAYRHVHLVSRDKRRTARL
jgi:hypothetical protein